MSGILAGTSANEPKVESDVLKLEFDPLFCRDIGVLLAGSGSTRTVVIGEILGADASLSIASAANGGNTGDGAISGLALQEDAQEGVYTLECITAAANGGVFSVIDPNNDRMADLTVATAYDNDEISLTLGDGAADFVVGDGFTITVTKVAGKDAGLDLAAVDGAQNFSGVALRESKAADGVDGRVPKLVRGPAVVARSQLVFPSGASAAQKAAIEAQMDAVQIRVVDAI